MTHKIVVLYQSLLGIYGDRGNAMVLTQRLRWRGEDATIVDVEPGETIPSDGLIYLLGGGEDQAQIAAVKELHGQDGLRNALDRGAVLLAICAGYQLCGHSFTVGGNDEICRGLGLLDVETRRGAQRAVGEILSTWTDPHGIDRAISGFENHGGFTYLGSDAQPLMKVDIGVGNGEDGYDGAIHGRVIGLYPHGPLLPRNPIFADYLLELALERPLEAVNHPEVEDYHRILRKQRLHIARTTKNRAEQTR